jgi:hypothetical protein
VVDDPVADVEEVEEEDVVDAALDVVVDDAGAAEPEPQAATRRRHPDPSAASASAERTARRERFTEIPIPSPPDPNCLLIASTFRRFNICTCTQVRPYGHERP